MTLPLTRLKGAKPVSWTTILGIVLVPLTVAGILLWGLWNPSDRLENVTAAVVNNDKPVEVNGQTVPLGRVLAGELIGGDADTNFTWQLTDKDDAKKGLKDGRYTTVITIPENFSAAATSLSQGPEKAKTAHIDIAESDQGRLIDTALSGIVTQTATSVLNQQLGAQFVGNVFVGMNELHTGIGKAADGASQLADGGTQLSEGATQLADGTSQLSDGAQQLSSGASELSTGAGALASGVSQYTAGASALSEAYAPLSQGASAAVAQLKTMIGALGTLQANSAGPQGQVTEGLTAAGAGARGLGEDLKTLYPNCLASGATKDFCDSMLTTVGGRGTEIGGGLATTQTGLQGLAAAQETFQNTITASNSNPGGDPNAQLDQLSAGITAFGTGLNELAAQGGQLSTGATQLAAGTSQLSTGATALAEGTPELADGASKLADGVTKSADGAKDLSKGLDEAVTGIPNYTKAERETLSEKAVTPVETRGGSDEIFTSSGAPLFAGIALWAGALASFLVLAPLWRRTRDAARGIGYITVRSALPALAIGAVQGAIAGVILPAALGYDLAQATGFFGFAVLAGISFALVVQGASALLGGFGRFIAFALLVVAFAVGVVSTVPGPLATIGDLSPVGSALSGFQAIASGSAGAGGSALLLVVWAGLGLILTALAAGRVRRAKQ
ncbi:YhgE/Pip domain-containing protein [Leucobacter viscericola]|uniref:YhgE/Pip domain-containing protein n=1 Tax=Leucobacter viscericola TaxID=2714935 RepID=A0A6G7XG80_9MICO|nr:YhgE/Pip domain-containing protein [Leucobacter viscericola]QIK63512.1 YhgE/Pip domain-containing protein [Leucobacter viscericola]